MAGPEETNGNRWPLSQQVTLQLIALLVGFGVTVGTLLNVRGEVADIKAELKNRATVESVSFLRQQLDEVQRDLERLKDAK